MNFESLAQTARDQCFAATYDAYWGSVPHTQLTWYTGLYPHIIRDGCLRWYW